MRLTVDDIMAMKPCSEWTRQRVEKIFGGRKWMLLTTIVRDQRVPFEDRIWVACNCEGIDRELRLFACDCAERALSRIEKPDKRSLKAIEVSRAFSDGNASLNDLAAARDTARDAARDTARAAAWDTARAAAWGAAMDTARAAAWDTARAAAWGAARAAAWGAARAAERKWQAQRLYEILKG